MANTDYIIDRELKTLPLETTKLLGEEKTGRVVSNWIIGVLLAVIVALFLPWQQNVRGDGTVTAFRPVDRPQDLPSRIDGRIEAWYVQEGQFVKRGDSIARISEIKEDYLNPNVLPLTRDQQRAKEGSITEKLAKARALEQQIAQLEAQRE
ncbi:MAG: biotin/lipoyl-binding protein, partial [Gemmatimonadaceae bacterium]|nr:biotin/lipoyl-binding protein [Gemmatimonadaceae bacterium]